MRLTLEPTAVREMFDGTMCRVWKGETEAGTPVVVHIASVSPQTHDPAALAAFDRELSALPKTDKQAVVFDHRFVVAARKIRNIFGIRILNVLATQCT